MKGINMRNFLYLSFTISLGISSSYAVADQSIDIIGGNNASVPKVAIVNFTNDMSGESAVAEVIKDDLNITGEFIATRYNDLSSVNNGNQYIITGSVSGNKINYQLSKPTWATTAAKTTASDTITSEDTPALSSAASSSPNAAAPESAIILNQTVLFKAEDLRKAEHTASNNIYQKITGTPGIFTSKIAFIVQDPVGVINKHSRRSPSYVYKLIVSDYDGYNQQTLATDSNPLSSISWNSDGTQIAYVAYESKPKIYIQNVYDSKKKGYLVADFYGSNSSPAFISGNSQLVATLTIDDQSHLYIIPNSPFDKSSTKSPIIGLQDFGTIDTEASVNGNKLVFTSNHDGGYDHPQIFLSTLSGDTPQDLTASIGSANTSAKFSHDGNKITFVSHNGGLRTYLMDLSTRSAFPVSVGTGLDLAPSFAPNDKLILFSSGNNQMNIVNTTGTTQTILNQIKAGAIIDQEWANNF